MTERWRQQMFALSKWMNCFFKKCVCFLLNFLVVKKSWCFSLRVVCCLNIWMYLLQNKMCQRYHATWFQSFWFFMTYFFILFKSVHKLEINVIWYWFSNGIKLLLLYYYEDDFCLFVLLPFRVIQLSGIPPNPWYRVIGYSVYVHMSECCLCIINSRML